MSRKIVASVFSRANFARVVSVLSALSKKPQVEIEVILGGSALLSDFADVREQLERSGVNRIREASFLLSRRKPRDMATSTGLAIIQISQILEASQPDLLITVADRYETLASAVAARYSNIPVAHIQGGEVTGSLDDRVRDAVSQLSSLHFPATDLSASRLTRIGAKSDRIFSVGCPSVDLARLAKKRNFFDALADDPRLKGFEPNEPFVLGLLHPDTNDYLAVQNQVEIFTSTLRGLTRKGLQVIWLEPNVDAGSDFILSKWQSGRTHAGGPFKVSHLPAEQYLWLLSKAACILGNSSSGIREAAFFGTPSVQVGDRQSNRERSECVIDAQWTDDLVQIVCQQVGRGSYPSSDLYGDGHSGQRIADVLSEIELSDLFIESNKIE